MTIGQLPSTRSGQVGYAAPAEPQVGSSPVADAITEIEATVNRVDRAVDELAARLAPVSLSTAMPSRDAACLAENAHSPLYHTLDALNDRLREIELTIATVTGALEV